MVEELTATYSGGSFPYTGNTYFFHHDANANVVAIIKAKSGSPSGSPQADDVAWYTYDPFGNTYKQRNADSSGYVAYNPRRFSSQRLDSESGFYYYGFRYYDPKRGRWESRDPIGELGGLNLSGFVGNDGVNWLDRLGLDPGDKFTGPKAKWNALNDARSYLRNEATLLYRDGYARAEAHLAKSPYLALHRDVKDLREALQLSWGFVHQSDTVSKMQIGRELYGAPTASSGVTDSLCIRIKSLSRAEP